MLEEEVVTVPMMFSIELHELLDSLFLVNFLVSFYILLLFIIIIIIYSQLASLQTSALDNFLFLIHQGKELDE